MGTARILVVDDSPTIRRVIDQALSAQGHTVIQNTDGASALHEAGLLDVDVMILDFLMPEMNGYQVIKSMIQDPQLCDIPVILMCTRADDIPIDALSGLELLEILPKPFSPADLQTVVNQVLEATRSYGRDDTTLILELPEERESENEGTHRLSNEEKIHDEQSQEGTAIEQLPPILYLTKLLSESLDLRGVAASEDVAFRALTLLRGNPPDDDLNNFFSEHIGLQRIDQPLPTLHGDLAAVPLPEVLQLLKLQGQTGTLQVVLNKAKYEVGFQRGRIIWVRANNARGERRLGQYFLSQGVLTQHQLDTLLTTGEGLPLGQLILNRELAQPADIKDALRAQAHDLVYELLRAQQGIFSLRDLPPNGTSQHSEIGFSVDDILFSALRRVNETRVFRSIVPTLDATFQRSELATRKGLNGLEEKIFSVIPTNDSISARQVAESCDLSAEDVEKYLFRLATLGRVNQVST